MKQNNQTFFIQCVPAQTESVLLFTWRVHGNLHEAGFETAHFSTTPTTPTACLAVPACQAVLLGGELRTQTPQSRGHELPAAKSEARVGSDESDGSGAEKVMSVRVENLLRLLAK